MLEMHIFNDLVGVRVGTVCPIEVSSTLEIGNFEETFPGNYIPNDEANICAFFAKKNYCWKPGCQQLHKKISADRWTDETAEIYKEASNNIDLPRKGAKVHARATNIVGPTMFYVNLPDVYSETAEGERNETYQTMMTDLNSAENLKQYKLLVTNPCIGELIVIFSSRRNKWFRANVYDIYDYSLIQVFLVDCGQFEDVHLDNCRIIEPQFIHLPYQAVYCTLANVFCETSPGSTQGGNSFLKELILDKDIVMDVVVSDPDDNRLEVIVNVENINVNETMVDNGICSWYMK